LDYNDWLERKGIEYKENQLYFSNVNVKKLALEYGTPIYITNEETLRNRFKEINDVMKSVYDHYNIHFAVKANSNLSVLKILDSEGSYFDCTSQGELFSCLKAGIHPKKIIYTGNMFTNDDFSFAISNDIIINLDSLSQLDRVVKVYESLGKNKEIISFRYNPEFGAGHHVHDITAGKEIKFGILEEQMVNAYDKAKKFGFHRFGIHTHIGSGINDAMNYKKAMEKYFAIIKSISHNLDIKFDFIDFGGGIGIPYRPSEDPFNLTLYSDIVLKPCIDLIRNNEIGTPVLKIEPGRFLTAESTILVTQINTIKDNGYKNFAGVDAGFNTLIRPTLYGSYHHIIPCIKREKEKTEIYDIVGPICESGDILGRNRETVELKEGDFLAVLDAGAYGFVMSSCYNSRPRAAEILLSNGKPYEIRSAETYDDLIMKQTIPDHLK
jgi:diaminopimelate decarboxylase